MNKNADLIIDGEGEPWRVDRLVRTYSSIDALLRAPIAKLADHEGQLTATVTVKDIDTFIAIRKAWAQHEEYQVQFVYEGKVVDLAIV
jgi:hypothetical protein